MRPKGWTTGAVALLLWAPYPGVDTGPRSVLALLPPRAAVLLGGRHRVGPRFIPVPHAVSGARSSRRRPRQTALRMLYYPEQLGALTRGLGQV